MLLRHDWVTLYANGIRYLEKAPLLYWSMAGSMRVSQLLGHGSAQLPRRRRAHPARAHRPRAGLRRRSLRPPGISQRTRRPLRRADPALLASASSSSPASLSPTRWSASGSPWQCSASGSPKSDDGCHPSNASRTVEPRTLLCYAFAACCALGVLTKGLIGVVFPIAIVAIYLLLTRGLRGAIAASVELHPARRRRRLPRHRRAVAHPDRAGQPRRKAIPATSPSQAATGKSRCPPTATSTAGPGSTSSTSSSCATSTSASPATTTPSRSTSSGASASSGSCRGRRSCSKPLHGASVSAALCSNASGEECQSVATHRRSAYPRNCMRPLLLVNLGRVRLLFFSLLHAPGILRPACVSRHRDSHRWVARPGQPRRLATNHR